MLIGGWEKLSLLDYPGQVAAIVFTKGCNFRCHFCYNPMLVLPESGTNTPDSSSVDEFLAFLRSRLGKLDAVVVTGGEPTIHQDLPEFLARLKELGFLIKLDTNGTNPEMLTEIAAARLVDYLAMDIKAPWDKYQAVVGRTVDLNKIKKSVKIIKESGLPYEFRTTVGPVWLDAEDIMTMAGELQGAALWYLQKFVSRSDLVNPKFIGAPGYADKELRHMAEAAAAIAGHCQFRDIYS